MGFLQSALDVPRTTGSRQPLQKCSVPISLLITPLRMVYPGRDVAAGKNENFTRATKTAWRKKLIVRLHANPGRTGWSYLARVRPCRGERERRIRLDVRVQGHRTSQRPSPSRPSSGTRIVYLNSSAGQRNYVLLCREPRSNERFQGEAIAQARAALPSKPLAVKLYARGLERLWAFDFVKAWDSLIQAEAVESEYSLTRAALSDAWNHFRLQP